MGTIEKAAIMTENTRTTPGRRAAVRAKDHASMAVVLAAASIAWFGWGHQGGQALGWLRAGMIAGILMLIGAVVVMRGIRVPPTMATDPRARRVYWISVVAEVIGIVGGAIVLSLTGNAIYLSAWTLLIVGVHFLPFVRAFRAPSLGIIALACALVAVAAVVAGLTGAAPAPTVAGGGGGIVLLGSALFLTLGPARQRSAASVS